MPQRAFIRHAVLSLVLLIGLGLSMGRSPRPSAAQESFQIQAMPGDTWTALSLRFNVSVEDLQTLNPHPNQQRQPTIGDPVVIPPANVVRSGTLIRSEAGGSWLMAAKQNRNPWSIVLENDLTHPSQPHLGRPIVIPSESTLREFPAGISDLTVSHIPARSGEGMAFSAVLDPAAPQYLGGKTALGSEAGSIHLNQRTGRLVGLLATGAFFDPYAPELTIQLDGRPGWSQPWRFDAGKEWTFNQITLTGSAAQISAEEIQAERARLFDLWAIQTETPQWRSAFTEPIRGGEYLSYSSFYGARRSYNGGPYSTYHEGLDFAAFGGTPVYAPASGTVILAETLYVRGGAVIIDHGLGIYTGYYHMNTVLVANGQVVEAGTPLGEVGTTGLSTGNHLHWDLLVNGIWVDPGAWQTQNIGCWVLDAWGEPCTP